MSDLRKAAEMALEALEIWEKMQPNTSASAVRVPAITALRQAIAEAEKQEPAFYAIQATDKFGEGYEQTYWEDPAGFPVYTRPVVHAVRCTYPQCQATNGCVGVCSKGQPDLAKVGEVGVWGDKREWVGLEEEEILKCFDSVALGQVEGDCVIDKHVNIFNAIRAIEAKLKEKNT